MRVTDITNWAYLHLYAPPGYKDWKTMSQEDAVKKSNKFIKWVIEASKGMTTMDKNETEPATDEELAEWVEERRIAAQTDYDELIDDFIDLERESSRISEIAASYDEAWY